MKICDTLTCVQCRWETRYWRISYPKFLLIEHPDLIDRHGVLNVDDFVEEDEDGV